MPYGNYNFVIDSHFQPFSFNEMLQPWVMYSNAYEKTEAAYDELAQKADTFKYLASQTDGNPRAKAIYENYANELNKQAEDLAKNGLSIANRRSLTNLKRRYQGEIGQLVAADEKLKELQKQRNALYAAGKTMLYANDNPTLDDFLGEGNDFNRYAIDSADLRARGNALGKAISSREYSNDEAGNVLGNQYRLWRQTHGIQDINQFMNSDLVKQVVANELIANGSANNLSGRSLEAAKQNILNGIYEGIIYEESVKPMENKDFISAGERARLAQSAEATALNAALYGYRKNEKGQWVPDDTLRNVKGRSTSTSGSSTTSTTKKSTAGANKLTQTSNRVRISWRGNNPNDLNEDSDEDYEVNDVDKDETEHTGRLWRYEKLPKYAQKIADEYIGDGDADLYDFYFQPYESGLWNDTEAELEIVPRDIKDFRQQESLDSELFGNH